MKEITQVTGSKRHSMLFTTIVSDTKAVAIGPLEYCGHGKVIQLPHGKTMYVAMALIIFLLALILLLFLISVSVVRHDPAVPEYYAQRELTGLNRRAAGLDRRGKAKKPMTKAQKRKRTITTTEKGDMMLTSTPTSSATHTHSLASSLPPPRPLTLAENSHPVLKKRRISADKALALSWKGGDLENVEKENFGA